VTPLLLIVTASSHLCAGTVSRLRGGVGSNLGLISDLRFISSIVTTLFVLFFDFFLIDFLVSTIFLAIINNGDRLVRRVGCLYFLLGRSWVCY
jgi:hypothetical protein